MRGGRPRTAIGTFGTIKVTAQAPGRFCASTRDRDLDGRLRRVRATDRTERLAEAELKRRLVAHSGFGSGGTLGIESSFTALADQWLSDLETRTISEGTKDLEVARLLDDRDDMEPVESDEDVAPVAVRGGS